ncbi:nuclear pore complex protein-like protein Nup107 [Massarina eburnea CBS 473.64]|uniref:Nuclear pore complex protein n=1 Tax=Massarina eburnea CBS 473.64 TaxID=1395130 RepID=A0A6A6SEI1_9PLEO|nr:nuclear pore complex protein-like protein Nup107 [Massarina eburnea CBS 473.64]
MSFSFAPRSQPALSQTGSSRVSLFSAARSAQDSSANDPLQPLRAMADRVGKEVEKFAERVDHWHTHGNESEKAKYQTTVQMVDEFRDLAKSTVDELRQQHDGENKGELDKSVRRRIDKITSKSAASKGIQPGRLSQSIVPSIEPGATPASSSMQELRHWQTELATWELVRVIIEHYHPEPGTDVAAETNARIAKAGGKSLKYSPKTEIWNRFLLTDSVAKEKKVVLEWLQQTSRNTESDIESIVEQFHHVSGKDTTTWTSGWLDTKVRLKQEKRMQGLDKPLDPDHQVKTKSGVHSLVTRLDPDAPYRQKNRLEESDEYYEGALWMVCYEMLRRGESWAKVSEWCKERNEAWRGVSLGAAHESIPDGGPNMAGGDLGYLYRRICFLAGRGATLPYEGAVYALLSGDVDRVADVSRSWDDHLYAYYNALLLTRFDALVRPPDTNMVPQSVREQFVFEDAMKHFVGGWEETNQEVVQMLMRDPATSAMAKAPLKLIQGALISRSVDGLMYRVGVAVADMLQTDNRLNLLMLDPDSNLEAPTSKKTKEQRTVKAEDFHQTLAKDHHALRILVHVYIALERGLHAVDLSNDAKQFATNNVVTFYIEFLRLTKRLQLIPLYAAQLGVFGAAHCMARVLLDIKNIDEQKRCMMLMKQYGINYLGAINENFILQLHATGYVDKVTDQTLNPISRFKIVGTAPDQDAYLWPGMRIMHDFAGSDISAKEEALIESLMWYDHLEKDVENTFRDLYTALETFLLNGRVGAAEKLTTEMSVETISLTKTTALCGYAFDFTIAGADEQDEQQVGEIMGTSLRGSANDIIRPSVIPSKEEHTRRVQDLRKTSQKYFDLCQIVRVISLLRQWRAEEEKLIQIRTTGEQVSMKRVKQLSANIEVLFDLIFDPAGNPPKDSKDHKFWSVYKVYIPEITIAYLSVLQSGAFFIHRDTITKAMDLATVVADGSREWLQAVFMETGRMKELVATLAKVSKAMLNLDEHGDAKKTKQKRGSKGETLRIWNLTAAN